MSIKLGLNIYVEEAEDILVENLNSKIKLTRKQYEKMTLFTMESEELRREDFENIVSESILEIILRHYSLNNIRKRLYSYREYLGEEERNLAYNIAKKKILNESNYILQKEHIKEEIIQYIGEYPIIYLDGFVMFRLKNLNSFVETVIEQSIESLNLEREYDNFMDVLKYLADSGDIGYDTIRVVFEEDDYQLLDAEGVEIDKVYFENIAKKIDVKDISKEDLLISTLLALSPDKILIHMSEYNEKETLDLIETIFENKVYYCYNCNNCIRKVGLKTR